MDILYRLSSFWEDFLEIDQLEKRTVYGGHVCERIGTKLAILIEDLPWCFLPSFGSFGQAISEEKIKMWKVNGRQMTKAHIAFGKVS